MAPLGYGLWASLKANPVLQWIAGAGAAFVAFFLWLASRDRRIRREQRRRIMLKSLEQAEKIKRGSDEKTKQVHDARKRAPRGVRHAGELRRDARARIIADDPDGGTD